MPFTTMLLTELARLFPKDNVEIHFKPRYGQSILKIEVNRILLNVLFTIFTS